MSALARAARDQPFENRRELAKGTVPILRSPRSKMGLSPFPPETSQQIGAILFSRLAARRPFGSISASAPGPAAGIAAGIFRHLWENKSRAVRTWASSERCSLRAAVCEEAILSGRHADEVSMLPHPIDSHFHVDRNAGRDHDHRPVGRPAVGRGQFRPQCRPPDAMPEQLERDSDRDHPIRHGQGARPLFCSTMPANPTPAAVANGQFITIGWVPLIFPYIGRGDYDQIVKATSAPPRVQARSPAAPRRATCSFSILRPLSARPTRSSHRPRSLVFPLR